MTEAEWLATTDPNRYLRSPYATERQRRLFMCACARGVLPLLRDGRFEALLRAAEEHADGAVEWEAVDARQADAGTALTELLAADCPEGTRAAAEAVYMAAWPMFFQYRQAAPTAVDAVGAAAGGDRRFAEAAEERRQTAIARDIFGNPFRPVELSPEWLTDTVTAMARQMYESREFGAMPILADALQDAGCEDETILAHCRGTGPHARGCWLVDLILGKREQRVRL